ncbi:hypothetical protein OESDEN_13427 [Oesophagostomum dentatum]|uniref:Uncharacterized protein n=1 Tax=Oesophagostomum dentatum TaxID=61180 RepID=A0A0B1STF2_OESDE|nr:hypothetical protein OESDEN_13427 [Oesophagostomum dentatum]
MGHVSAAAWKVPGPDGLTSEQLSLAKEHLAPLLATLLNGLKRGDSIPDGLTSSHIKLLFKKANPNDIKNYRPISLSSATLKAVTRAILDRIEKTLEETENASQIGFRKHHSTINHIHVLKQIAEKSAEYNFPNGMQFGQHWQEEESTQN